MGVESSSDDASFAVSWKDAANFRDLAAHMVTGDYSEAVVMVVNSTPGCERNAAVRIALDNSQLDFRGFKVRFWLGDKPFTSKSSEGEPTLIDFDWIAHIPCAETLT